MEWLRYSVAITLFMTLVLLRPVAGWWRQRSYSRGRRLSRHRKRWRSVSAGTLRWGNGLLPDSVATSHFLVSGTTGSGKSHCQRLLLKTPLLRLEEGRDERVLIYDSKGDSTAFLKQIGMRAPVYTLNPYESREDFPQAVSWAVASDITSPTDALNLACSLIRSEEGSNRFFSDSARLVVRAVVLSLIRNAGASWTFADLVQATTGRERLEAILSRDTLGQATLADFLPDNNTGYGVASTIYSNMVFYEAVAAQWQRAEKSLSLKAWLKSSSVLILCDNEAASASLLVVNRLLFRFLAERIDTLPNSSSRRIWVWIDEAREAKSILQSDKLNSLAVKGRSRGVALVLGFQDIDGLRHAAGRELANELVAQCSHKALLRCESKESAEWASGLLGQYECLEVFHSGSTNPASHQQRSEQRVLKDAVLPSELFEIPATTKAHGLTGYFVAPAWGAHRTTIDSEVIEQVVVSERLEAKHAVALRPESEQWLQPWTVADRERLKLSVVPIRQPDQPSPAAEQRKRLKLNRKGLLAEAKLPKVLAS